MTREEFTTTIHWTEPITAESIDTRMLLLTIILAIIIICAIAICCWKFGCLKRKRYDNAAGMRLETAERADIEVPQEHQPLMLTRETMRFEAANN